MIWGSIEALNKAWPKLGPEPEIDPCMITVLDLDASQVVAMKMVLCCERVRPLQGSRGFRGQKTPISQCLSKGRFSLQGPTRKNGDFFGSNRPFSEALGNGSLFGPPKPSFPDFHESANHALVIVLYSNSVLTLYGLILAPILNLFKPPFLVLGS